MDEHSSAPPSSDSLPGTNSTKATENSPQDELVVENKTKPQKPSKFKQKFLNILSIVMTKFEETVFINYLFY